MPECEVFPSFSSSCLSFERKKKRRLTGTGIPLMQEINQVQCELLVSRRYHTDKLVRKRKKKRSTTSGTWMDYVRFQRPTYIYARDTPIKPPRLLLLRTYLEVVVNYVVCR